MVSGKRITSICRYMLKLNILCTNLPDVLIMYDPKLYIVSPTITGLVLQVFEVLEVRSPHPPPPFPLWELTSTPEHLPNP